MFKFFYISTEGRIGREVYWLGFVVPFFVIGLLIGIVAIATTRYFLIVSLLFFWPTVAMMAKRLHDMDKSAWFALLSLLPYVGWVMYILLGFIPGTEGPNRYGPDPFKRTGEVPSAL